MAHGFDNTAGGWRLIDEASGAFVGAKHDDERPLIGLEHYGATPDGDALYLARQRARFKAALLEAEGLSAEEAEDDAAAKRWDRMPNGQPPRRLPTDAERDEAEADFPALAQRARVRVLVDKAQITADGQDEATVTFTGLVAPADIDLGDGLVVTVDPADPELVITSDVPRRFEVRALDDVHWSRPLTVVAIPHGIGDRIAVASARRSF